MSIGYHYNSNSQPCKLIKETSHTKGISCCTFKTGMSWSPKDDENGDR